MTTKKKKEKDLMKATPNILEDRGVISNYLETIEPNNKFYIDIGSSNEPNLDPNIVRDSDLTILCECDAIKHPCTTLGEISTREHVHFIRDKVTPSNVVDLISNITKNIEPKFVDIDIDGYDFFVLEALLKKMTPTIIMAEINEKIPPPIKFTVKYDPNYWWDTSHFYGMSLSKLYELLDRYGYDLINLTFNNAYAVRKDKNPGYTSFTPEEAYDVFYKNASDREHHFGYNGNVNSLLELTPEEGIDFIRHFFSSPACLHRRPIDGTYDSDRYEVYI